MEYQVPQFIEVEDKIVGPLTLKQFIYLAGGAGLCVIFFTTLPLLIAAILAIPFAALALALAFYRVNGKPFIDLLEAGFNYYVGPKIFLWRHEPPKAKSAAAQAHEAQARAAEEDARRGARAPRLTRGKLSELAWSLDIKKDADERAS